MENKCVFIQKISFTYSIWESRQKCVLCKIEFQVMVRGSNMDLRRMRTHRMNHLLHPWLVLMHHLRKELFLSQVPLNPVYPICCLNKQPYVSPVPPFLALSGKSRSPSLLPDLRGKLFCLLSLSTMFAVSFPYMIFSMLRQFPPVPNFYHEWCQMLSIYYFFLSTEILVCVCVCVLFPCSVDAVYYTDLCVEPSLYSRSKSHLVMEYNPVNIVWKSIC